MTDRENNEVLDRAMEYTGVVGVELADMLVSINSRLLVIELCMPVQHMFGGDGLQDYIPLGARGYIISGYIVI